MISALLVTALLAAEPAPEPLASLRGGAWLTRLGGTIEDGGGQIDLESNILLNTKETSPLVEFHLTPVEGIRLNCSVFDFSTAGSGTFVGNETYGGIPFNNGEAWRASTKMQSVGFSASLDVITPYQASEHVTLTFAPVVGLRWFGLSTDLENVTRQNNQFHQQSFVALQGGATMAFRWDLVDETTFIDAVSLQSAFLVGGMFGADGGSIWSVTTGIEFEVSPTVGFYFGYRLQELAVEDGAYHFDAGLQGLYFGGQLQF